MLVIISLEPLLHSSEKYHSLSHSLTFLLSFGLRQLLQCMLIDIIRLFQKVTVAFGIILRDMISFLTKFRCVQLLYVHTGLADFVHFHFFSHQL